MVLSWGSEQSLPGTRSTRLLCYHIKASDGGQDLRDFQCSTKASVTVFLNMKLLGSCSGRLVARSDDTLAKGCDFILGLRSIGSYPSRAPF